MLTAEQIRAGRALIRWGQGKLASESGVSVETVKRLEGMEGQVSGQVGTIQAIKEALETAGIQFIDKNGGGPGVRLRQG